MLATSKCVSQVSELRKVISYYSQDKEASAPSGGFWSLMNRLEQGASLEYLPNSLAICKMKYYMACLLFPCSILAKVKTIEDRSLPVARLSVSDMPWSFQSLWGWIVFIILFPKHSFSFNKYLSYSINATSTVMNKTKPLPSWSLYSSAGRRSIIK